MRQFFQKIDPFVVFCFGLHDLVSEFIMRHLFLIKRFILAVAYVSLSGVLFPEFRKNFGSLAQLMLLFILFLSPVSKIFRMRLLAQLIGLRREFGILMGCLAIVHGVAYFVDPTAFSLDIAPYLNENFFSMQPLFYFGILSLILTLTLLLTSNDRSQRLLGGRRWKLLHRIAYVLLLTVLLHVLFIESAGKGLGPAALIQPVGIIGLYVVLKALSWKNFISPLRDIITYVSDRYQTYTLAKRVENVSTTSL